MRHYIKTVMLLAAVLTLVGTARADAAIIDHEEDDELFATQASLSLMIHRYSSAADTIAKELSARFKGNAKMQTAIGRAYFQNRDHDKASIYLSKAIRIDPKYAKPYVIYGQMFNGDKTTGAFTWDIDSAAYYYNKAIEVEPKNYEAYIGLAKAYAYDKADSMKMAKATLKRLSALDPDFNVDVAVADLYIDVTHTDKDIVENLGKVDPNTLSESHLGTLVVSSFWTYQYDKCKDYSFVGMNRFPKNKNFGRFYARSLVYLGDYTNGLKYGHDYIETLPMDSLVSVDMYVMGTANIGTGEFDKGFEYYNKISTMHDDWSTSMDKEFLSKNLKKMRVNLVNNKEYDKAATLQQKIMKVYPYENKALGLYELSNIYLLQANDSDIAMDKRQEIFKDKAMPVFDEIEKQYSGYTNASEIMYYHAHYYYTLFDPKIQEGSAKPYYQKMYNTLTSKKNQTKTEKQYLGEACWYFGMTEYSLNKNVNQARIWWERGHKIDSTNETLSYLLNVTKLGKK